MDMKNVACLFSVSYLLLLSCSSVEYHGCAAGKAIAMKSSSEESSDFDGCTGPPRIDNIKLSSNELLFNAEGGIDSITTEGEDWYMLTLEIGDTVITLRNSKYYVIGGSEDLQLYEPGIITNGENVYDVISIEHPWFSINKPENKKIIFSVNKNETEKEREFLIDIVDHRTSYYTFIKVNQSAD